jgi:tetratricopeptide (TPR) repeat protein
MNHVLKIKALSATFLASVTLGSVALASPEADQALSQAAAMASLGRADQAITIYNRVLRDFAGEADAVAAARKKLVPLLFSRPRPDLKAIGEHLDAMEKGGAGGADVSDWKLRLALYRVLQAPTGTREKAWVDGTPHPAPTASSGETLAVLDALIQETEKAGEGALADRILADLDKAPAGSGGQAPIRDRIRLRRVLSRFEGPTGAGAGAATPDGATPLRRAVVEGRLLEAAGNHDAALAKYTGVIKASGGRGPESEAARRRVVLVGLATKRVDPSQIQQHLDALSAAPDALRGELWDAQCRLVLRQVAAAGTPDQREQAWSAGMKRLQRGRPSLSDAGLGELELALATVGNLPLADRIPADLVLLFPEASSLAKLQMLRSRRLSGRGAAGEAEAAAHFATIASVCGTDGPFAAPFAGEPPKSPPPTPASSKRQAPSDKDELKWLGDASRAVIDAPLKQAAQAVVGQELSPRRAAFVRACTGDDAAALAAAPAVLQRAGGGADAAEAALDDVALIAALADRSFEIAHRRAYQLATGGEGPRNDSGQAIVGSQEEAITAAAALPAGSAPAADPSGGAAGGTGSANGSGDVVGVADEWLDARQLRFLRWGGEAFASTRQDWAERLWAAAINAEAGRGREEAIVSAVVAATRTDSRAGSSDSSSQTLERLAALLKSPTARATVQRRSAEAHFENSKFEGALRALDAASREGGQASPEPMSAGFTRVLALISLGRQDDALAQLRRMREMSGTDEERARARFLVGWVYLKADDKPRAAAALEEVIDEFPRTTFGKKAKDLLQMVQGES